MGEAHPGRAACSRVRCRRTQRLIAAPSGLSACPALRQLMPIWLAQARCRPDPANCRRSSSAPDGQGRTRRPQKVKVCLATDPDPKSILVTDTDDACPDHRGLRGLAAG
ncbi:MAG: hypothetical protein U5O16_40480 [Rhodococcus sp. (in: high G+C Gram-positive bacteria)]|uniref:hypothetical protein n=1 Tax=Rhodococcus sp. TaxID=1831 RepID=UPI002AD5D0F1|nr:hypothetical protein [Rhodococcus sp. (in: high G+C Gram-positive bacteria)]